MIKELDTVVLTKPLHQFGLEEGDMGTVVMIHRGGAGFEVEFTTLGGDTLAVVTLVADAVRPVGQREIAHVRQVA